LFFGFFASIKWSALLTFATEQLIYSKEQIMEQEKKAKNLEETIKEMSPFVIYAAIPIFITICIALIFGTR
jgi:hypothetical protein